MNDTPALYFWVDGQVVSRHWGRDEVIKGVPCVDLDDPPPLRYGMFVSGIGWKNMPLEELPADFRLTLMLMGVPL